jgi:hypothetical protein
MSQLTAAGSTLGYSTFIGGSNVDSAYEIAVDGSGAVFVAGLTWSTNFPTTSNALDTSLNGQNDAFVNKFTGLAKLPTQIRPLIP